MQAHKYLTIKIVRIYLVRGLCCCYRLYGSVLSDEAAVCVCVFEAVEGDGEVVISPVQNCSHCESDECHETKGGIVCYCDEDLVLDPNGVSCINATGLPHRRAPTQAKT